MATVRTLLADHATLHVRSVDRPFLQAYVPKLISDGLLLRFLLDRGFPIPSPAGATQDRPGVRPGDRAAREA